MKKMILFIHSAGPQGSHDGSGQLIMYLREALGPLFHLITPQMPDPLNPEYLKWKECLKEELEDLSDPVIVVGHSIGGSVLLKYFSEHTCNIPIVGLFSIGAPYWGFDEHWHREDFFMKRKDNILLSKISKIFLYHSYDEEIVPFAHMQQYKKICPHAITRGIEGNEHLFNNGLPQLVADIKANSNNP